MWLLIKIVKWRRDANHDKLKKLYLKRNETPLRKLKRLNKRIESVRGRRTIYMDSYDALKRLDKETRKHGE